MPTKRLAALIVGLIACAVPLAASAVGDTTTTTTTTIVGDQHHPDCAGAVVDLDPGDPTPIDGIVWLKVGNDHIAIGYRDAGFIIPLVFDGKDVSHADVCPETVTTTSSSTTTSSTEVSTSTTSPPPPPPPPSSTTTTEVGPTTTGTAVTTTTVEPTTTAPSTSVTSTSSPTTTTVATTAPTLIIEFLTPTCDGDSGGAWLYPPNSTDPALVGVHYLGNCVDFGAATMVGANLDFLRQAGVQMRHY